MKKKIISGVFALALLATAGFGVNKSVTGNGNAGLNEMALANVEAFAENESGGDYNKLYVHCEGTDVICLGSGDLRCCK